MSLAAIVAVTRMREGRKCVGALELEQTSTGYTPIRNLRLHKADGAFYHAEEFAFKVGQILELEYLPSPNIRPPHTEDCRVQHLRLAGTLAPPIADRLMQIITQNSVVPLYRGSIDTVFEGLLQVSSETGSRFIERRTGVPSFSTCFWIPPHELEVWRTTEGKIRLRSEYRNIVVPYIAEAPLEVDVIPAGGLLRLSLARWWSRTQGVEPVCYLQVSQYYGKPALTQNGKDERGLDAAP